MGSNSRSSVKAENDQMKSSYHTMQLNLWQISPELYGDYNRLSTCSDEMKPSKHLWILDKPQKQVLKQATAKAAWQHF